MTAESLSHIITKALLNLPVEVSDHLPREQSIKRTLRNARQKAGVPSLAPFRMTKEGELFLRFEGDGIFLFAANVDLEFWISQSHWFGDGTFKITPVGFSQLYTIHAMFEGKLYPCVYMNCCLEKARKFIGKCWMNCYFSSLLEQTYIQHQL